MTPQVLSFVARILNCSILEGFEVQAFWGDGPEAVDIRARHPYGVWHKVTIYSCDGALCESENGSPMTASDVATRLRRSMRDKGPAN